jgi:5-methylcytosine-specific restriction endonuclease McrA
VVTAAQRRMAKNAQAHERSVQRIYGLKPGEYQKMLDAQDGRCAICGNKPVTIRLAVDHDHVTGRVRGLLCRRCNRALGLWEGDPQKMRNLISYVRDIMKYRVAP